MAILAASLTAGILGFVWLRWFGKPQAWDDNLDTMDFEDDAGPNKAEAASRG